MTKQEFGARLQKLREEKGLSQWEFGRLVRMSGTRVGVYERGNFLPTYVTADRFARGLGVTVSELLGGEAL